MTGRYRLRTDAQGALTPVDLPAVVIQAETAAERCQRISRELRRPPPAVVVSRRKAVR